MLLLGDEAQVEALLKRLEILLILTQDRCTVCVELTIGSEVVFEAPDGTPSANLDTSVILFWFVWR